MIYFRFIVYLVRKWWDDNAKFMYEFIAGSSAMLFTALLVAVLFAPPIIQLISFILMGIFFVVIFSLLGALIILVTGSHLRAEWSKFDKRKRKLKD